MRSTPWNKRIAEGVVRRNEILMKYDKENAEQLISAEKELYWSWSAGAIANGDFRRLPGDEITLRRYSLGKLKASTRSSTWVSVIGRSPPNDCAAMVACAL